MPDHRRNSGGPVIREKQGVGVAFQGIHWA